MPVDPDAPAGELLAADFVAPPPPGRWAAAGRFVGALVRIATADATDPADPTGLAAQRDVLVTRRDTGATVLRIDGDEADEEVLVHVRDQLDTLTTADFLDRWGLTPDDL